MNSALPIFSVLLTLLLASCNGDPNADSKNPPSSPEQWSFEHEFGQGRPVTFVLRVDRTELPLSGTVTLEEELRIEEGFQAGFSPLPVGAKHAVDFDARVQRRL